MTKNSILIVCTGLALGLFFLLGNISRFFSPLERILFSASSTFASSEVPKDNEQMILKSRVIALEEENTDLKKLEKVSAEYRTNTTGRFIGREIQAPTLLIIDQGSSNGVTKGSAVLSSDGALVGKVIEIKDFVSIVRFITDPDSSFSAMVLKRGAESAENGILSGVVEGAHGLGLELRLVPADQKLEVGDLVVTSGEEIGIPRGIPIGTISEVLSLPGVPLQEAILSPFVSIPLLLYVDIAGERI
jgi:rod shape-determining protein MreC